MCLVLYYGFDACDSLEPMSDEVFTFVYLLSQYLREFKLVDLKRMGIIYHFTISLRDKMLMNCALGLVHFHCNGMTKELKSSG